MFDKFRSIKLKTVFAIILSIVAGILVFVISDNIGQQAISGYYLSETLSEKRIARYVASFQEYVDKNKVKSSDYDAIKKWCEDNKYIYFMLFDNDSLLLVVDGDSSYEYTDGQITDTYGYEMNAVEFTDGEFNISLMEYSEEIYYSITDFVSVGLGILAAFCFILIYTTKIINRITTLSRRVAEMDISSNTRLEPDRNDEIGTLYSDVENMKETIVYHYEKEKETSAANRELITNMSHDIRTPLTSIIGYNEMMLSPDATADEVRRYAQYSLEKALQLKDMSDRLFQYFLVYDKEEIIANLQTVSAKFIIQQIVGEQSVMLAQCGFKTECDFGFDDAEIKIDPVLFKRVFDNIYSNITKYSDKEKPVKIHIKNDAEIQEIQITVIDYIAVGKAKQKSTGIGLKSCDKIMKALGGSFAFEHDKNIFITTIVIPYNNADNAAE